MSDIHSFGYIHPTARVLDPHLSIFTNDHMIRVGEHSRIDGLVKLEGGEGLVIGRHVHIASFSHINVGGGMVEFGDHSGCSSHVVIGSGMPELHYLHISAADPEEHRHPVHFRTVIGKHVVIFAGAIICPGVTIGDGSFIAAGAVVNCDVPPFQLWGGVPAKMLRHRNVLALRDVDVYEDAPHWRVEAV